MPLSAGRTTAIDAVKAAFTAANAETDPAQKDAVQTDIATEIVDAIITLITANLSVAGTTTGGAPDSEHAYGPSVVT
jgi:hypothetical protein